MADGFVDTSGWYEFLVHGHPKSGLAINQIDEWQAGKRRIITTNYVLAELVPLLLSRRIVRPERDRIIDFIRSAPWLEIVHVSRELDFAAWDLLKGRPDKTWSLVDCTSFVLMRRLGIRDALTTDHHFAQAGFRPILA